MPHQVISCFFFQAEDGIRDRSPSRGLGDVYKRQEEEEEEEEEEPEHHGESQEQEESGRSIARSLRVSRVFVRAIEIDWWCRFF